MVTTNQEVTVNKWPTSLYISIWVFIFVLLLSIGFYFYNSVLNSKIENIQSEISTIENNIKTINEDEKVKLYTLMVANKTFLDRYKYLSNVPEFINNLALLSKNYKVAFDGFSYSSSEIVTDVLSMDDAVSLASLKTKNFIEYFRKKDDNIFSLWFVDSFDWQDNIKFSAKFKIK